RNVTGVQTCALPISSRPLRHCPVVVSHTPIEPPGSDEGGEMADRSVAVKLAANVTGFVSGIRTAQKAAEDFATRGLDKIGKHEQSIRTLTTGVGALGLAMVGFASLAVKRFADFDEAMSSVQASTMESADNMALLREAALEAGARTVYSATEAAGAIEELAKAGISTA